MRSSSWCSSFWAFADSRQSICCSLQPADPLWPPGNPIIRAQLLVQHGSPPGWLLGKAVPNSEVRSPQAGRCSNLAVRAPMAWAEVGKAACCSPEVHTGTCSPTSSSCCRLLVPSAARYGTRWARGARLVAVQGFCAPASAALIWSRGHSQRAEEASLVAGRADVEVTTHTSAPSCR